MDHSHAEHLFIFDHTCRIFFAFFLLRVDFGAECKMLCEEPDESFLASIGDPTFNPKRNPDKES